MLKPQKVTLEDVAKDAGVGKGTVDRVIHNRGYVSEEARRKVEQSIKKLGLTKKLIKFAFCYSCAGGRIVLK